MRMKIYDCLSAAPTFFLFVTHLRSEFVLESSHGDSPTRQCCDGCYCRWAQVVNTFCMSTNHPDYWATRHCNSKQTRSLSWWLARPPGPGGFAPYAGARSAVSEENGVALWSEGSDNDNSKELDSLLEPHQQPSTKKQRTRPSAASQWLAGWHQKQKAADVSA